MTQITKEQADSALNTLWITSESCNSDEKLRDAVDQLGVFVQEGCSARPETAPAGV